MADYCHDCYGAMFGNPERNDMKGFVPEGDLTLVLCECCGPIIVDHAGKRATPSYAPTCDCAKPEPLTDREKAVIQMAVLHVIAHYIERDKSDTSDVDDMMIRMDMMEATQDAITDIVGETMAQAIAPVS